MQEKAKELLQKVLEWWNKFTSKQKTIIVSIAAVVVFTFAILIYAFSKPQYTLWRTCDTTTEAAEVKTILEDAGITYKISDDALRIQVLSGQVSQASLAVASAGYVPDAWTINDVTSGGFSTTEADKQRRYKLFMEGQLADAIESQNAVRKAEVLLDIPDSSGTLLATSGEVSAYIQLTLRDRMTTEQAANIAKAVATGLGTGIENITIVDTDANLLYSGEEGYSITGTASSMLQLKAQAESLLGDEVTKVLIGTKQYDLVSVASNLEVDFSSYEEALHEYSVPDGKDQGYYSHYYEYESENSGSSGGVPGTDSNDENGYLWQTGEDSESTVAEKEVDYLVNELMKKTITSPGVIKYEQSAMSVSAISYRVVKEEDVKRQGLLAGTDWETYKLENNSIKKLVVDEEVYRAVSNATRIPVDKITILAYEEPLFVDAEGLSVSTTDILSIVLIVIILALLAVVVLKSMAGKKTVSEEEELSVESLLQSTPETDVEDIELETKSETRKMIEKFVDENPEAAANLLRNWLSEDWG